MNNEQNDVLERCNLFIDHQLSWAGDGYFCENCRVRFEPVPNERSEELPCYCAEINSRNCPRHQNSEESAEPKYISRIDPDGVRRVYDLEGKVLNHEAEYSYPIEKMLWFKPEDLEAHESKILQTERTRIIKVLEGLKVPIDEILPNNSVTVIGQLSHNKAIDQAIKAIKETASSEEL